MNDISRLDRLLEKHEAEQQALTDKLKATELEKQQALVDKLKEVVGSEILEVFSIQAQYDKRYFDWGGGTIFLAPCTITITSIEQPEFYVEAKLTGETYSDGEISNLRLEWAKYCSLQLCPRLKEQTRKEFTDWILRRYKDWKETKVNPQKKKSNWLDNFMDRWMSGG